MPSTIASSVDIIVLCKDNYSELFDTLHSIQYPVAANLKLTVLVIDGSEGNDIQEKIDYLRLSLGISINYHNLFRIGIHGIYPSMNYALSRVSSDWCCFLNSGDFFCSSFRIDLLFDLFVDSSYDIVFGKHYVLHSNSLCYISPYCSISNISFWLKFFEPCHQSMFIRSSIPSLPKFNVKSPISALMLVEEIFA